MLTRLALEDRARLVTVNREATAGRANRRAFGRSPTDHAEGVAGFVVAHTGDLRQ